MPLPGAKYRYKKGTNMRLAFQGGQVVEAKNMDTGAVHTPAEFAADRKKAMKPKGLMKLAVPVLLLLLAGCSVAPSDEFMKALAADTATVCVQVNTIYGRGVISRTNIANGNVQCNADGLTVKSDNQSITVPIQSVPTGMRLVPEVAK